jgi:hypothetical protein
MPDDDENNEDVYEDDEPDESEEIVPETEAKYRSGMKFVLTTNPCVNGEGEELNVNFRGKVAEIVDLDGFDEDARDWEYRCHIYELDGKTLIENRSNIFERELERPYDINWEERMKRHVK